MRSTEMSETISKIDLEGNPIILTRVDPAAYFPLRWELLKRFKNLGVALVSLNMPCYEISSHLKEKSIEIPKLFVVDGQSPEMAPACLSPVFGQEVSINHTTYAGAPGSLTGLSITMRKLFAKNRFDLVILDSLSTLLIYNEPHQTQRFVHALIEKLRSSNTAGIFITLEGSPYSAEISGMTQFFDSTVQFAAMVSKRKEPPIHLKLGGM
jgi:hypothetical protein